MPSIKQQKAGEKTQIKNVLIASPVCQEPLILNEFLESFLNLQLSDINADFLFIDDNTDERSKELLKIFKSYFQNVNIIDMQNKRAYMRTEVFHKWDDYLMHKVTQYRNMIIDIAKGEKYDYLFMVDSDILLHPLTLKHLIEQKKDIISEIFWTKWAPGGKEYPQVWLYDNYTLYEIKPKMPSTDHEANLRTEEFLKMLKIPGIYKVGGLGACTLISSKAIFKGVNYERIPNISFWGEDRHFCIRAAVLGFDLYVDTFYPAYHIYRKKDLKGAIEYKIKCGYSKNFTV